MDGREKKTYLKIFHKLPAKCVCVYLKAFMDEKKKKNPDTGKDKRPQTQRAARQSAKRCKRNNSNNEKMMNKMNNSRFNWNDNWTTPKNSI